MAQNLKARTPLYVGLGLAGMGGYYLYQAGGDPNTAKNKLKGELSFPTSYTLHVYDQ